jgi:hypothetical protein
MKNNKEFIEILDGILLKQRNSFLEIGASYNLDNYAFCCSKIWDNGIEIYKGIPVYYFNAELMKDIIQLIPSPMYKDYER